MVQTVNDRNQKELERVLEKEMNYDKAMGTYKVLEEDLYDKTSTYVDDYGGISYSGNNVDLGSHVGYVTKHGVFKHYPNKRVFEKTAGRNGCPSGRGEQIEVENSRKYNREGAVIPGDPDLIVGSRMVSGQACGGEGGNYYVTHVGSPRSNKFVGCYTDKSSKAIPSLQPEGAVYTASMCKQRANDLGKKIYGLQNYNPETKLSECYVGDNLSDATQYGKASKPEPTWSTGTQGTSANALLFAKNGNLSLHKIKDNLDSIYKSTTLEIPVGGSVKNLRSLPLPYAGIDVSPEPTNSQNPKWKDTFSVEVDGDTLNVRRIDQGTGWGQNLQLKGKTYRLNDAIWNSKSQIGNCPLKYRKSTDTTSILKVPEICKGAKLIMQDDGNLVVYDNKNKAIWASNTWNRIGDVTVDEWIDGSFKKRDYLKGGDILQTGEWIASKSGKNRAILQEDGNFVVYRSREGCVKNDKDYYGKESVNAIYELSGTTNKNIGKVGYIDSNTNLFEYPNNLIKNGTKYSKIGNYDSKGNTIKTIGGGKEIKIAVGSSDSVSKTIILPEDDMIVDPIPQNPQNSSWSDRFSVNVSGRKLIVSRIDKKSGWGQNLQLKGRKDRGTVNSVIDCKNACNKLDNCAGFVYQPSKQTCYLKDDGMFPNGTRFQDDDLDLYVRLPKVSNDNSCSNKVKSISSTRYSDYPKSSDKMTKQKPCSLKKFATPHRNILDKQDDKVDESLRDIAEDMDRLKKENRLYKKTEKKLMKNIKDGYKEMTETNLLMEQKNKNKITIEARADDSELMYIGENYKYLFYTVGAIVTVVAMLKLLPRVETE